MLAVGGRRVWSYLNIVELYSFQTNSWEVVADHPLISIRHPAVISLGDVFFTFGGEQVTPEQSTRLIYGLNTTQKTWFPAGMMRKVRQGYHNAFVDDDKVIIAGKDALNRQNAVSEKCSLIENETELTFDCKTSAFVTMSEPRFFEVQSEFNKC